MYRSRSRRSAQKELEWQREAVRKEMNESQQKLRQEFEVAFDRPSATDQDDANGHISPSRVPVADPEIVESLGEYNN
jgi:hypothetical protein